MMPREHDYRNFREYVNPAWMASAPCAGMGTDYYGEAGRNSAIAKAVCKGCPNRVRCLEYAIDNDEQFGIWGGMSTRERRALARNRRAMGWATGRLRYVIREAS